MRGRDTPVHTISIAPSVEPNSTATAPQHAHHHSGRVSLYTTPVRLSPSGYQWLPRHEAKHRLLLAAPPASLRPLEDPNRNKAGIKNVKPNTTCAYVRTLRRGPILRSSTTPNGNIILRWIKCMYMLHSAIWRQTCRSHAAALPIPPPFITSKQSATTL